MTATTVARRTLFDLVDDAQGRVVCLAMSKDPNAKVTVLLFRPGEDHPKYAAKVPTTAVAARRVQHEVMTLSSLDRTKLGVLSETIPEVAEVVEHMGWPVLVTTALPGRVMLASYHQWRHTSRPVSVKADFDAAGCWLAELHRHASTGEASLAGMIDGVATDIALRFGDDLVTAEDDENLLALRTRLDRHQSVRGLVHGDFWPGNLLTA